MKFTKEERLEIGRKVYTHELTEVEAQTKYSVGRTSIQNYVRQYKDANGITEKHPKLNAAPAASMRLVTGDSELVRYRAMSKEELIDELIKSKVNEARAKKGYEVKGDGANKEFVSLSSKNSKSS